MLFNVWKDCAGSTRSGRLPATHFPVNTGMKTCVASFPVPSYSITAPTPAANHHLGLKFQPTEQSRWHTSVYLLSSSFSSFQLTIMDPFSGVSSGLN